ncbi:MAG: hypothetical protein WAV00_18760 [Nocardioides sp.]
MTDLETRLRDGLGAEAAPVSADALLRDVRRGLARRRARRATGAVVLVTAAIVAGSIRLQHGRSAQPPQPAHSPSVTSTATTDAASSGRATDLVAAGASVYRLTSGGGCSACSSVWRRTDSGWEHLHDFEVRLDSLAMSADGRDGFAWGLALWATHDGGSTWTLVTAGPGRRTVFGRGIAVGDHDVWALRRSQGTSSSWRSALGSDTWQRVVDAPRLRDIVSLSPLVSGDQVAFQVSGEGGSGNALVVGRPGSWREVAIPFGTEVHVRTDGTTVWASNPEPQGLRLSRLSGGSWQDLGRVDARSWWPLDGQRVLLQRQRAAVFTDHGIQPTDLHPGAGIVALSRSGDGTYWLLTLSGLVLTSTDGAHWTPVT